MELKDKNILIISSLAWGVNSPERQLYARELVKKGNFVYFLNPPSKNASITTLSENLYVVDYKTKSGIAGMLGISGGELAQIKKILNLINKKLDIVWSFDNSRFGDLTKFGDVLKIFSLEEWSAEPNLDNELANSADLILGLSQSLLDKVGEVKGRKQLIHHALGTAYVESLQKVEYIRANTQFATGRIRCGYVGNLQNKFIDTEIFETIIRNNPVVEFHLIGPFVKDSNLAYSENKTWEDPFVEFLMSAPNVRMYGSLMNVRAAEILQTMDLFLVCYDVEKYRKEVANPQKIMEYLSSGKVVVANYTDTFASQKDLLLMADTNAQLPTLFKKAVDALDEYNEPTKSKARIDFALSHTYEKQLVALEQILNKL